MAITDTIIAYERQVLEFLTVQMQIPQYVITLTAMFLLGLVVCLWILQFSKQLARKNLFTLKISHNEASQRKGKVIMNVFFYILEYLIIFPLYTIFWGGILVIFLLFMVASDNYPNVIFFATVTIAIIRAIAYFNETYATELAKQLPLWLLVSAMLDPQILTKVTLVLDIRQLFNGDVVMLSVAFIVMEEWALRLISEIRQHRRRRGEVIGQDVKQA